MPSIVLDEWVDLGVRGCRSITVTQRRTVPGFFEMQTPVAYWTMDEASGTRLDSFGINDVTESFGAVPSVAGVINNAAAVPSTAALVRNGVTNLWTYANGITMAGWFKFAGPPLSSLGNIGVCGFGLISGSSKFRLSALSDGNLYAEAQTAAGLESRALFVGVVFNTFIFIRMWVDPADDKVHCRINEGATQDGVNAMTPFILGSLNLSFTATPQGGDVTVDEIGVYGSVLTDADGAFLYNSGLGQRPPLP